MSRATLPAAIARSFTTPAARQFERMLSQPGKAQTRLLQRLVRDASRCVYGMHHDLGPHDDYRAFAGKIPVTDYEELRPWVQRALIGEDCVLSPHAITRVETTSGSTAEAKVIPYSRPWLRTFNRMFSLWSHDLLKHHHQPRSGRIFISVTSGRPDVESEVPPADDRDYLSSGWQWLTAPFLVTPDPGKEVLAGLAECLDRASDLEAMSFWSPTLLLEVLDHLDIHDPESARRQWPQLQLISCWTSGSSARYLPELERLFPEVHIQGKGLLATEGPVTLPWTAAGGFVPLVEDVFLEFMDDGGGVHCLEDLEAGGEYELLVSHPGGFLRYRLGDRVCVSGRYKATPLLTLLGRTNAWSDLVGEKLNVDFVEQIMGVDAPVFCCLTPDVAAGGYRLILEHEPPAFASTFESRLFENPHYARAITLGQLAPLSTLVVPEAMRLLREAYQHAGLHPGDLKPTVLVTHPDAAKQLCSLVDHAGAHRHPADTV